MNSKHQGIVHIIGPELGITQPGQTIVCGDSHTSTHGAFGTLAFGIGTSEVEHVLATQCLVQSKSKTMQILVHGKRPKGVTAKDIILAIIGKIGIGGGTSHVAEYGGQAIRELSMDGRMTVCNMTIEGGARAGMIAPDETTFAYLEDRAFVPRGKEFAEAVERWKLLTTDDGGHNWHELKAPPLKFEGEAEQRFDTNGEAPINVSADGKTFAVSGPVLLATNDRGDARDQASRALQLEPGNSEAGAILDQLGR